MGTYKISVDVSGVALQAAQVISSVMPSVQAAVGAVANEAAARWKSAVMHAPLAQFEKEAYVASITWSMDGPFSAEVSAGYAGAGPIESGRPARDLKQAIGKSLKARVAPSGLHAGQKYLIIPFRHNTPGNIAHAPAMPESVYYLASQLPKSKVVSQYLVPNVNGIVDSAGLLVQAVRSSYQWGGALPAGLAPKLQPHHVTDPYAGMVRMGTNSGGQKSSAYLTFRVMGQWSSGWIVPAKPGLNLAQGVALEMQPLAEQAIRGAVEYAVAGALKGS